MWPFTRKKEESKGFGPYRTPGFIKKRKSGWSLAEIAEHNKDKFKLEFEKSFQKIIKRVARSVEEHAALMASRGNRAGSMTYTTGIKASNLYLLTGDMMEEFRLDLRRNILEEIIINRVRFGDSTDGNIMINVNYEF